jgi:hypothetical protein
MYRGGVRNRVDGSEVQERELRVVARTSYSPVTGLTPEMGPQSTVGNGVLWGRVDRLPGRRRP